MNTLIIVAVSVLSLFAIAEITIFTLIARKVGIRKLIRILKRNIDSIQE